MAEEQLVIFQLNKQNYAISVNETKEIIRMVEITKVPNTEHFIEGIINLRGDVTPVINLNRRLGLYETEYDQDTRIIVVERNKERVGMIVDAVNEVGRCGEEEVESADITGEEIEYLRGVIKKGDDLWLLLDLKKVL